VQIEDEAAQKEEGRRASSGRADALPRNLIAPLVQASRRQGFGDTTHSPPQCMLREGPAELKPRNLELPPSGDGN